MAASTVVSIAGARGVDNEATRSVARVATGNFRIKVGNDRTN